MHSYIYPYVGIIVLIVQSLRMHEHKNIDETVANKNEQNQRQCLVSTWYYKARGWIAFTANIKMTETEWIQFNDIDDDGRICVYYIYDYISIYVHLNESMALCFVFCWLIKIGVRPWATKYHISCISVLARIFWNGQKYLQLQLLFGWRFMFIQCIESEKNLHNLCLFARFHCAYIFRFIFFAILFFSSMLSMSMKTRYPSLWMIHEAHKR